MPSLIFLSHTLLYNTKGMYSFFLCFLKAESQFIYFFYWGGDNLWTVYIYVGVLDWKKKRGSNYIQKNVTYIK